MENKEREIVYNWYKDAYDNYRYEKDDKKLNEKKLWQWTIREEYEAEQELKRIGNHMDGYDYILPDEYEDIAEECAKIYEQAREEGLDYSEANEKAYEYASENDMHYANSDEDFLWNVDFEDINWLDELAQTMAIEETYNRAFQCGYARAMENLRYKLEQGNKELFDIEETKPMNILDEDMVKQFEELLKTSDSFYTVTIKNPDGSETIMKKEDYIDKN